MRSKITQTQLLERIKSDLRGGNEHWMMCRILDGVVAGLKTETIEKLLSEALSNQPRKIPAMKRAFKHIETNVRKEVEMADKLGKDAIILRLEGEPYKLYLK